MEKRLVLAMVLTALVLVVIPRLFTTPPIVTSSMPVDSTTGVAGRGLDSLGAAARQTTPVVSGRMETGEAPIGGIPSIPAETTVVVPRPTLDSMPLSTYRFVNQGATLVGVELLGYQALTARGGNVQIARQDEPLLRYRLALAHDTVVLDNVLFRSEQTDQTLTYTARIRDADVAVAYTFVADSYVVRVRGTVQGGATPAHLLIDLPRGIRSEEADSTEDHRHLAYAYKPMAGNARSIRFDKLDPGEAQRYNGPLNWVVTKNKYFVVGLLTPVGDTPFQDIVAVGGPRTSKVATTASATIVEPITDGQFIFEIYAGPQDSRRLLAMGRDFQDANPYGGWLQGVVQPFARIVMQILLWIRDTFQLNYGWVLVIFGIAVRIALWPLNQRAMRASLRMQQIQPQLMEVQKRYQDNPEKQRSEMMRVYKEHNMTPFSPMVGCLPMLLPMPILFALFFVFQNTIEFRGVSFLWLPDISLKDPYYIVPILMGLSMFVLSWIGIRNAPPNPQAKMMAYFLPVLMTVFFLNFASGLNLYYAVQNIAALPQQWLIANERAKTASVPKRA